MIFGPGGSTPDGPPRRAALLMEMAEEMASTESLGAPLARFEGQEEVILDLEAKGLVTRHEGGRGSGSATRRCSSMRGPRLCAGTREHRSLHSGPPRQPVRRPDTPEDPRYLREASPDRYLDEMAQLWAGATRRHIRLLLIDFLGQVQDPTEREQAWMSGALGEPDYQPRALAACRASTAWFRVLAMGQLPAVMLTKAEEAWHAVPILAESLRFARSESLELIRRYWLPDPEKDLLTWRVLEHLTEWEESTVELACEIGARRHLSDLPDVTRCGYLGTRAIPAPRLVAASLERSLRRLEAASDPPPPTQEAGESDEDFHVREMLYRPKEKYERLIDAHRGGTISRRWQKPRRRRSSTSSGRGSSGCWYTSNRTEIPGARSRRVGHSPWAWTGRHYSA